MAMSQSLWLEVTQAPDQVALLEYRKAYRVLDGPQSLSAVILVGHRSKTAALQGIMRNSSRRSQLHGGVSLWRSKDRDCPLLLMDCELHLRLCVSNATFPDSDVLRRPLAWTKPELDLVANETIAYQIYARLLAPMANVVCFFAADFGSLRGVARKIADWSAFPRSSDLPPNIRPRLLVVVETSSACFDVKMTERRLHTLIAQEIYNSKSSMRRDTDQGIYDHFQEVGIMAMSKNVEAREENMKHLRDRLIFEANDIQILRRNYQFLFKPSHLKAMLSLACDNFCASSTGQFKFALATRAHNPIPDGISSHVQELIDSQSCERDLIGFAAPLLSSALVLDSCPPEMHRRFHPDLLTSKLTLPRPPCCPCLRYSLPWHMRYGYTIVERSCWPSG